jgi:hypothetical protein
MHEMSYTETIADGTLIGDIPGIRPGAFFVIAKSFMTRNLTEDYSVASRPMDRQSFSRVAMLMMTTWAMSLYTQAKVDVIRILGDKLRTSN